MIQFPLQNNDSFLTQCCISNPTVESHKTMITDSSSTMYRELRSAECERLSLSFGRNKDRDKEQQRGEENNGRTGWNIPV